MPCRRLKVERRHFTHRWIHRHEPPRVVNATVKRNECAPLVVLVGRMEVRVSQDCHFRMKIV
jgi:hypothetical protein